MYRSAVIGKKSRGFWAVVFFCMPVLAHAAATDPLIEGAKLCTRYLPRHEREYGIPVHLLSAISSTESGRWHDGLRIALPWPWTINAEGKGYYFDTKEQAVAAAKKMRARGVRSMDVGCMQVNLMHHPEAFSSIEEAFEPERNIAYAAGFLRSLYEESGSWRTAAAGYHSKTPAYGTPYAGQVYDRWYTILGRVRNARAAMSGENARMTTGEMAAAREAASGAQPVRLMASAAPRAPKISGVKIIKVRDSEAAAPVTSTAEARHENGLLVIRPQPVSAPVVAEARSAPALVSVSAPAPAAPRANAPRFIFSD